MAVCSPWKKAKYVIEQNLLGRIKVIQWKSNDDMM